MQQWRFRLRELPKWAREKVFSQFSRILPQQIDYGVIDDQQGGGWKQDGYSNLGALWRIDFYPDLKSKSLHSRSHSYEEEKMGDSWSESSD